MKTPIIVALMLLSLVLVFCAQPTRAQGPVQPTPTPTPNPIDLANQEAQAAASRVRGTPKNRAISAT